MELTQESIYTMAPFAETLGVTFPLLTSNEVRAELVVSDAASTLGGGLHGGALMTLCDLAAAVLVGLNLPEGTGWTTAESTTYFLRPVTSGSARAVAQPIKLGRSTATVEIDVTDDDERPCVRTSQLLLIQATAA